MIRSDFRFDTHNPCPRLVLPSEGYPSSAVEFGNNGGVPPNKLVDRYAPSPTSDLHVGNLRTALAGWLLARRAGGQWRMRIEDLDEARVRAASDAEQRQLRDLAALGLTWDGALMRQSERIEHYREVVEGLQDRAYECFCTRKEIAEAASAPHYDGYRPYPGTCSRLSSQEAALRRENRPGAIRIRSEGAHFTVIDRHAGEISALVDDFVLVRGDGAFAYNLAVVVDDIAQDVTHITRGADLLSSAPRQAWLTELLGGRPPTYAHVGLVTNSDGVRLAKRDGAVTLGDLQATGISPEYLLSRLTASLGLPPSESVEEALTVMPAEPGPEFFAPMVWKI